MQPRRAALLAVALCCRAQAAQAQRQSLSWVDHTAFGVSAGLIVADWATTTMLMRAGVPEQNPLLGRHPSSGRVAATCAVALLGDVAVMRVNGRVNRMIAWVLVSLIEEEAVRNNIGIRLRV